MGQELAGQGIMWQPVLPGSLCVPLTDALFGGLVLRVGLPLGSRVGGQESPAWLCRTSYNLKRPRS